MYIIKHILPLIILSIVIGFVAAQLDFSRITGSSDTADTFDSADTSDTVAESDVVDTSPQLDKQLQQVFPGLEPEPMVTDAMHRSEDTVVSKDVPAESENVDALIKKINQAGSEDDYARQISQEISQASNESEKGNFKQAEQASMEGVPVKKEVDQNNTDGDWSVDHFLSDIQNSGGAVEVEDTVDNSVSVAIAKAAKRTEAHASEDPYLASLLNEARDLSVTAVVAAPGADLVRNNPKDLFDKFLIVESGDSLSEIANRFYGDPMAYQRIYDANRDVLNNPDMVPEGQQLRIPMNTQ